MKVARFLREEVEALYEAARERRRQSGKAAKQPTKPVKSAMKSDGEIQPLIDHSLPPEALDDQNPMSLGDAFDTGLHHDELLADAVFDRPAHGKMPTENSKAEPATASVDLSPIVPGKPGRAPEGTVIGGRPKGHKNFRRGGGKNRAGGKSHGRAGGRTRRRP